MKSFYESNIQMFANPDQYLFEEWIFNSEFERSKLVELLEALITFLNLILNIKKPQITGYQEVMFHLKKFPIILVRKKHSY